MALCIVFTEGRKRNGKRTRLKAKVKEEQAADERASFKRAKMDEDEMEKYLTNTLMVHGRNLEKLKVQVKTVLESKWNSPAVSLAAAGEH